MFRGRVGLYIFYLKRSIVLELFIRIFVYKGRIRGRESLFGYCSGFDFGVRVFRDIRVFFWVELDLAWEAGLGEWLVRSCFLYICIISLFFLFYMCI